MTDPTELASRRPITAFVSYSHRDTGEQAELRKHLAPLERQRHLRVWNDARILAGDDWSPRISENLERSQLVLVLLSPDYFASDACSRELARTFELRAAHGVRLLPIVLRACDWQSTPLAGIQLAWGVSTDAPLTDLPPGDRRDRAFQTIVERLKPVLRDLGATLGVDAAFDLDLAPFDVEAHRRYLTAQHGRWAGEYAPLEAEPLVAQLGSKFKPIGAPPVPATQVARQHPRLVLIGGAGTGKTTTLLYLAQALARETAGEGSSPPPVCVYVQLSRFRRTETATPLEGVYDLIAEALHNSRATRERVLPGAVGRLLERLPAVLLLDALNEVAGDRRSDCLRGVSDLVRRHPSVRVALTSRPHGFNAQDLLEGWEFFALTELSDEKIAEVVERRLGKTALAAELLRGLASQQSLLRVPLFLRMVLELGPLDPERALKRLGNRSGLIKDYADYLLGWNQPTPSGLAEAGVRGALMQAARVLQAGGQHVREDELRRQIEAPDLEEALRRSVLARDEGYIHFFHQIVQEHFCAAALIDDWRRRRTTVRGLPRELRRSLKAPSMVEVASHVIAIAADDEAGVLLEYVAGRVQGLTLRWLDDICAESPPRLDIAAALRRLRRSLARGLRFSRLPLVGRESTTRAEYLAKVGVLAYVAGGTAVMIATELRDQTLLPLGDLAATGIAALVGILLASFVYWTFVPASRAEALLMAARETRSPSLRQQLMVFVAQAAASRLANPSLQGLAASLLGLGEHSTPVEILSSSVAPYAAIRVLAYDSSRLAFHLLATLLAHDNCYGLAALRALDVRAGRFPRERTEILSLVRRLVEGGPPDWRIYVEAHRVLLERRSWSFGFWRGSPLSFWPWAWRRYRQEPRRWRTKWKPLTIALGIAVPVLLLLAIVSWHFAIDVDILLGVAMIATNAVAAPFVYRDAKRIGAGSLRGGDGLNEFGPRTWAAFSAVYGPVAVPLYLWQRGWILRSVEPDWKVIEAQAREASEREAAGTGVAAQ